MNRSLVVLLTAAILGSSLVLAAVCLGQAQDTAPNNSNPVVSSVPFLQETAFEPDPFEPTRLRASKTTTVSVVVVRADGSTEVKRVR